MADNYDNLYNRAKALYRKGQAAVTELQSAKAAYAKANAAVNQANAAVNSARQLVDQAARQAREDGDDSAVWYAQQALSQAEAQFRSAYAASNAAAQRVNAQKQIIRQCISGFQGYSGECQTQKQGVESALAKLDSILKNNRYGAAAVAEPRQAARAQLDRYTQLDDSCRKAAELFRKYAEGDGDNKGQRVREH